MTAWDLRHPRLVKAAWAVVFVLAAVILVTNMRSPGGDDSAYGQPVRQVYYQPLTCFDNADGHTLTCDRPYNPISHVVK